MTGATVVPRSEIKNPEETLLVGLLGTEFDGLGFRLKGWEGVSVFPVSRIDFSAGFVVALMRSAVPCSP